MWEHVKNVHRRNKDFKCELCDYTTARKWHLNRHLEKFHSDDPNDSADKGIKSANTEKDNEEEDNSMEIGSLDI